MKDFSVPALVPAVTEGNLSDLPARNAREVPNGAAFSRKDAAGAWSEVTWTQFNQDVRGVAKGLVAFGVEPGDRVAIMARTRYEWTLMDFACWTAGAIVVPIYETSSAEQVQWILTDSGAKAILVETAAHQATVDDAVSAIGAGSVLEHIWQIDDGAVDILRTEGDSVTDEDIDERRSRAKRADVATLIYTSGTTGRPKGVQLTHDNFQALAENATERLGMVVSREGASTLLFLPLAHVFARFIEVLCVEAKAKMGHSADIKNILDDFAGFQPTFVLAVPRVFEKIYNSAEAKATNDGKGKIFEKAAATAIEFSEAQDKGGPSFGLKAKHALFNVLVYGKLRKAMGGQVQYAVSGGAPLGTRLGHFFRGIGVTILEGYGLTETTAPLTVNTPELIKIGTVGPPLPGTEIHIAEDGEILTRGVGVFGSYHDNAAATEDAFEHGWFRTGDLGELDDDGYLKVTGRKKEILVTAAGKNVAPAVLEDRLRAHPLVSQCIVVGDQRPFIAALITLDEEMWPSWATGHELEGVPFEQARTHPKVLEAIQGAVDSANKAVSKAESIRKFVLLPTDFTEENGCLTPSLKVKRNIVMRDFADQVEEIYAG